MVTQLPLFVVVVVVVVRDAADVFRSNSSELMLEVASLLLTST